VETDPLVDQTAVHGILIEDHPADPAHAAERLEVRLPLID